MTATRFQTARERAAGAAWHWRRLSALSGVPGVVEAVLAAMTAQGYTRRDCFAVHLTVEEAVVNAITHGHGGDPAKVVEVRFRVTPDEAVVEVTDEGPGFDPARVADPHLPENLERPGGRGLLLMRHYMTSVEFGAGGRAGRLGLRRSLGGAESRNGKSASQGVDGPNPQGR